MHAPPPVGGSGAFVTCSGNAPLRTQTDTKAPRMSAERYPPLPMIPTVLRLNTPWIEPADVISVARKVLEPNGFRYKSRTSTAPLVVGPALDGRAP